MKRLILAILAFLLGLAGVLMYKHKNPSQTASAAQSISDGSQNKENFSTSQLLVLRSEDKLPFFDFAKENIPVLTKEIADVKRATPDDGRKIEHLEGNLKAYKVATIVANKDIEALKKMTKEELQTPGQIWVPADRFKDQMKGLLASRIIGAQNAIGYVIFHSATNKTEEDNKKTLEMLQILLDKKLNPNALAGDVFWVKNKPEDKNSYDYVGNYSFVGATLENSFPEVLELLLKNGAVYSDGTMERLKVALEKKLLYAQEFEKILSRYSSQRVTPEEAEKRMQED